MIDYYLRCPRPDGHTVSHTNVTRNTAEAVSKKTSHLASFTADSAPIKCCIVGLGTRLHQGGVCLACSSSGTLGLLSCCALEGNAAQ